MKTYSTYQNDDKPKVQQVFNYIKSYYNYSLILIGLSIISWIIWTRFIRPRVPKDIPFELTEKWFYVLVYICIIYLYMVYSMIKPREPNEAITQIVNIIYIPLIRFDEYMKSFKYVNFTYKKLLQYILSKLIKQANFKHMKRFYIGCYIIPRSILIIVFCLDTFYFNKLEWIYKIILIGIIPLLHRYAKFCLNYAKDDYIKGLDAQYSKVWVLDKNYTNTDWEFNSAYIYHNMKVTIKEYVEIQTNAQMAYIMEESEIEYSGDPFIRQEFYDLKREKNTKQIEEEKYDLLCKEFNIIMPKLLHLSIFLKKYSYIEYSSFLSNIKIPLIKHVKIIIFSLYFICWIYILYRSYHMIPYPFIETLYKLIITLPVLEEPFSGDLIINLNNDN